MFVINLIKKRVLFIMLILLFNVGCNDKFNRDENNGTLYNLLTRDEIKHQLNNFPPGNLLVLFINFDALNCHTCAEDFLNFCDTLSSNFEFIKVNPPVLMIIKKGSEFNLDEPDRLNLWKKYNRAEFQHIILSDTLFNLYGINDIIGIVLDKQMKILYKKDFPMGKKSHLRILELLQQN